MILYHASDLIWATRIKRTADDLGIPARPVRTEQMLKDRLADSPVAALIVDLEDPDTALALVALARFRQVPALAFGPHVHADRFEAARSAGAQVLTRGAFDRRLPTVLQQLAMRQGLDGHASDENDPA